MLQKGTHFSMSDTEWYFWFWRHCYWDVTQRSERFHFTGWNTSLSL